MEFTRRPSYEVRGDRRRIYVELAERDVDPPFKKRSFEGEVLRKIKFVEGFSTSEIIFYTGDEFSDFSTFEMGEPFRLVLDMRREGGRRRTPAEPSPVDAQPPDLEASPPGVEEPAPPPPPEPRAEFVVVIDPGHGGDETGARGPSGLLEKDVTLDIARRLKTRLERSADTDVLLTRDSDRSVSLDERTAIANHNRANLFVSIHANSSRRGNAHGAETYFLSYQATDDASRAVAAIENNTIGIDEGVPRDSGLAMVLWELAQSAFLKESSALAETIQDRLNRALGINNRGIKQAPFRVLMGATMPAVLIEVGFISNPAEERSLRDPAFQEKLASTIAESIQKYGKTYVLAGAR
jgi:N-acetylmuramoyl-L-alanine amidase